MVSRTSLSSRRKKAKPLRDKRGRFASRQQLAVAAGFADYLTKDQSPCGKGQYKSYECKARAIRAGAVEQGEATERQAPYIRWLHKYERGEL